MSKILLFRPINEFMANLTAKLNFFLKKSKKLSELSQKSLLNDFKRTFERS